MFKLKETVSKFCKFQRISSIDTFFQCRNAGTLLRFASILASYLPSMSMTFMTKFVQITIQSGVGGCFLTSFISMLQLCLSVRLYALFLTQKVSPHCCVENLV